MKTYYKNPRTGALIEFDSDNNTAVELVKIGELVEVPGEEDGKEDDDEDTGIPGEEE